MKRIVTMQDLSCIGKCSLTVALPVLSAMGLECAVLPTAVLSAHTAFEGFRYEPLSLTPVADHWQQLGLQFDMIYTGYLGGRAQVDQALDFFTRFPAMRLVDPVMADHGALHCDTAPAASMHATPTRPGSVRTPVRMAVRAPSASSRSRSVRM